MTEFNFHFLTLQFSKKKGTGFAIGAIERDYTFGALFAVAYVNGEIGYDILWYNLWRK